MAAPKTVATYDLDGSSREFDFSFDYLSRTFVQVTLIGTERRVLALGTEFTFVGNTRIRTGEIYGPPEWGQIEIRRVTSTTERLVDFQDASILRADDLNLSDLQVLHVAEEAREAATETIGTNNFGHLDARGRRIVNVADPVDLGDVVTKRWYEADVNGVYQNRVATEQARDKAKEWATKDSAVEGKLQSAKTYAGQASASATNSKNSANASQTYSQNSAASASSSAASASAASESAGIATAQANIATTQANIATTQAGIATTQAGIATTAASSASSSAAEAGLIVSGLEGAIQFANPSTTVPTEFVGWFVVVTQPHIRYMMWDPVQSRYKRAPWHLPGQLRYVYRSPRAGELLVRGGVTHQSSDYPDLAEYLGVTGTTFTLDEVRGEFIRTADNGRGKDAGRVVGSHQGDAGRNLTGSWYPSNEKSGTALGSVGSYGGVISPAGYAPIAEVQQVGNLPDGSPFGFRIDASNQWPVANEFRPTNVAYSLVITY